VPGGRAAGWFPPFGQHGTALHHALIEYSHRFLTTVVVVLIILLVVAAWRRHGAAGAHGVGGDRCARADIIQAGLGPRW
jgi:heme A synthase